MAEFEVSKNDNGDVHVIVDDVVCVSVAVKDQDKEGKWIESLAPKIALQENPRTECPCGELCEEDCKLLTEAVQAAVSGEKSGKDK